MLGQHLIKAWSATQVSIALSSGEEKYYGVARGTGIALGCLHLLSTLTSAAVLLRLPHVLLLRRLGPLRILLLNLA